MADVLRVSRPPVFIVDDDLDFCGALLELLSVAGWAAEAFDCTQAFLDRVEPASAGLLLLDVELPDASGVELQASLAARGDLRPIIFMTGHEQISVAVEAMKGGAIEFLIKPFEEAALLTAIDRAATRELARLRANAERAELTAKYGALTPRERQVLEHVVTGKLNKQIANEMSLAEITVKVHRSSMMQKLKTSSVAALVRLHDRLFAPD